MVISLIGLELSIVSARVDFLALRRQQRQFYRKLEVMPTALNLHMAAMAGNEIDLHLESECASLGVGAPQ